MLKGVDHVDLIVSDMDEAIAFYTEKLGLTLRYDGRPDGGHKHTFLGNAEGSFVALEEKPGYKVGGPQRLGHLAFAVDDVKAARKELDKRGVEITGERTDGDGRAKSYYFTGPDGIRLEIYGPL
ncbi:Glutathione transferase FosA [Candidatus Methylomirabilis lanthanidiphila]|uniref:Glutathione transferase FosA n=1 Tax=Candidatus Methylomirabilis lanthanidiphila TaxID=2211376 RepID=A0A564ZLB8_9BACT|nr:VOC family protein [Candidatus Methylomirabilis lanthanidiphila]VUZ85896.1 Glutathione transferase FosA [Candidatus Methylomirabilis lanthanidiphila]